MSIISISRDGVPTNPDIVRIQSTDSLATVFGTGYLTAQLANTTALNGGLFTWLATDTICITASDGNSFGYFENGDFTTIIDLTSAGSVSSITGTQHQVLANGTYGVAQTGAITLTTPQNIDTTSSPTFASVSANSFLAKGSSSGTISILPQAASGTYNFNLPITAGTSGYFLTSAGGSSSAMTWTDPSSLGTITTVDGDTGSAAPSAGVITITGGSTGLTTSGTSSTLTLTGTLALGSGGTGSSLSSVNSAVFSTTSGGDSQLSTTLPTGLTTSNFTVNNINLNTNTISTTSSSLFLIPTSGKIIAGVSTQVASTLGFNIGSTSTSGTAVSIGSWTTSATGPSFVNLSRSRGTPGSFVAVQSGDILGQIQYNGDDGTIFSNGVKVRATVSGTVSSGVVPTSFSVYTTNTLGTSTLGLTLDQAQVLTLANPLAGASGGTGVANTGLTISLASGASGDLMTSDSSGNGTWVSPSGFQLKNNIIAQTSSNLGGTGAGPITVTQTGVTAASIITASLVSSSNPVEIQTVTPGSGSFDVTFTGDPGASAIINYIVFIAAQ